MKYCSPGNVRARHSFSGKSSEDPLNVASGSKQSIPFGIGKCAFHSSCSESFADETLQTNPEKYELRKLEFLFILLYPLWFRSKRDFWFCFLRQKFPTYQEFS